MIKRLTILAILATSSASQALEFSVPGILTHDETAPFAVHTIATGPAELGVVPTTRHEGPVSHLIWEVPGIDSTLGLLAGLQMQLEDEGFETSWACETRSCGGFDFRFGLDILPAPEMFIDLSDFHYIAAFRDDAVLSLVVSRSGELGYVQLTMVGGPNPVGGEAAMVLSTRSEADLDIAGALSAQGVAILDGVAFETGKAALASDLVPSLVALAEYLTANPDHKVALVGHTDAEGGLDGNVSLSVRRAEAVRELLVSELGVNAAQLEAKGIGYLAPRASNLTDDGRAQNRRVEAVLTSTQ